MKNQTELGNGWKEKYMGWNKRNFQKFTNLGPLIFDHNNDYLKENFNIFNYVSYLTQVNKRVSKSERRQLMFC